IGGRGNGGHSIGISGWPGRPGMPGPGSGPSGFGVKSSSSPPISSASGKKTFPIRSAKRTFDAIARLLSFGHVGSTRFETMSSDPLDRIRESNRQAIDAWPRWAAHRDRVMDVLTSVAREGGHLCLLGAGQLNDVRTDQLRARHPRITLVDVDR